MSSNTSQAKQDDVFYYDILIPFDPNFFRPATYSVQLNQPLLDVPEDYYMSVIRASVPCQNVPIFVAKVLPFPNTNRNTLIYTVTLTYNGFSFTQNVVYQTTSFFTPIPPGPSASVPSGYSNDPYYYVYEYANFLAMINTAYQAAFVGLGGLVVLPVGAVAPWFEYESDSQRISLVAQIAFYDQALALPIGVYVNYHTFQFFDALPSNSYGNNLVNGQDFQFIIRNQYNNWYTPSFLPSLVPPAVPAYYRMEQEYDALVNWTSLKTLSFVSSLLPVTLEYIPSAQDGNIGVLNSNGVVFSLEPFYEKGSECRSLIQFQNPGEYQLINMHGRTTLNKVDISIFWGDVEGRQTLVLIPPGQSATMKLMFIRKSLYKSMKEDGSWSGFCSTRR